MGGLLAFEIAQRLRETEAPDHVFISGVGVPRTPQADPWHALPRPDFLESLRQLGGLNDPVATNSELLDVVLPTLRADFEISELHTIGRLPPLVCPMTGYAGASDHRVPPDAVREWSLWTRGSFTLRVFPGLHSFLDTERTAIVAHVASVLYPKL